jgi:hypothetical protein
LSDLTNTGATDTGSTSTGTTDTGPTAEPALAPDSGHLEGRGYTVGSFVMAVLAILVIPPLHGIIGAVLGYIGHRKGDSLGKTAMLCSLAAMVVGGIVAAFAFSSVT